MKKKLDIIFTKEEVKKLKLKQVKNYYIINKNKRIEICKRKNALKLH